MCTSQCWLLLVASSVHTFRVISIMRISPVSTEIFGCNELVKILVFPSAAGYMLWSFGFPLLIWGIFHGFFQIDWWFSCSLELQLVVYQTQRTGSSVTNSRFLPFIGFYLSFLFLKTRKGMGIWWCSYFRNHWDLYTMQEPSYLSEIITLVSLYGWEWHWLIY